MEELKSDMLEALNLKFEDEGKTITEMDLKITLDLPQFFEFYKVINAKALSECIGINQNLCSLNTLKALKNLRSNKPSVF